MNLEEVRQRIKASVEIGDIDDPSLYYWLIAEVERLERELSKYKTAFKSSSRREKVYEDAISGLKRAFEELEGN